MPVTGGGGTVVYSMSSLMFVVSFNNINTDNQMQVYSERLSYKVEQNIQHKLYLKKALD